MTYYTGEKVDKKVEEFGLQELDRLLKETAAGTLQWGGAFEVCPANPADIEAFRVVIYSMLHKAGLKPDFEVKLVRDSLVVQPKKGQRRYSSGTFSSRCTATLTMQQQQPAEVGGELGDEGLIDLVGGPAENLRTATSDRPFDTTTAPPSFDPARLFPTAGQGGETEVK